MPGENLFPHLWRHVCELEQRRVAAWQQLTTPEAVRQRQQWVRATVQRMIGPFPARCDLDARVTRTFERDDYTVESIVFDSRPNWPVTATLYLPKTGTAPFPAVVSPCGHSANGRLVEVYQRAHIGFVKQGFAVLSYDPVSQGERLQYLDAAGHPQLNGCCHEHCMAGNQVNLVGAGFANIRIWDGIRALDYLLTRPEVDGTRVAVAGNSGGGTLSAYLLCMDDRYAAGSPNCYVTTLVERIATRMAADAEQQFVPMLREGIDHADLLLPMAPKPVQIGAAIKDFFPIDGARRTRDDLRRIYEVLGAADCIDICETNDVHGWNKDLREGAVRWFNKHLRGIDEPYAEPDFAVEPDEVLYATATGQVLTSIPSAIGVHALVQRDFPVRRVGDALEAAGTKLAAVLGIDTASLARPWPRPHWQVPKRALPPARRGVRVEPVRFLSDYDVDLSGLLFRPATPNGQATVFVPDTVGMAPQLAWDSPASTLAAAGTTVLTLDVRGTGSDLGEVPQWCGADHYHNFYGVEVDLVYTSWMIGRPLLGQRVYDVLAAIAWLRRQGRPVSVAGQGQGGLLALLAAALDPAVASVSVDGMLVSWQSLYDTEVYEYLPDVFVPDVLNHFDLPQVAATLAPRPLRLANLVDARRQPLTAAQVADVYEPCRAAYQAAGAAEKLMISADGEPPR